ncbi:Regulatory protein AfsR [Calidithermus terrae]|uniref:Regulatory protein AfsR n=1 Tax=Calidithermus terrae TaxID=1408545 RepID=A0A399EI35_9DEIN|nr:Regulatory protein AfsR [Calidithermus terrae]
MLLHGLSGSAAWWRRNVPALAQHFCVYTVDLMGIGKSRLVQELVRHLRELGMSGLLGAGHSIEQQTPYRAWRDVFASYFGLEGLADGLERQEQVRRVVQEVAPKLAPRLPLLNDLLNLGLPDTPLTAALDPALRQESLVALLVQLLRAWAQERPLTLVLEDAYWLDSLSWDLVVKVARALLGALEPLLLVVVTRPIGEQALGFQAAQALRGLPGSGTLEVGALGVEETAALVAGRLGLPAEALPPRLARLVRERSGGNPFFAEELTHALREQGLIRVEAAPSPRLEVSPGLFEARSVLPDTLQGVVLSRIDRLLPDRQLTLKVASVIGRNYPYLPLRDGVMRLAALGEALLHQHLHELIRRGLILLEAPDPEPLYAFKHAITYEVTYHSLLFAQRRQIHRVLAEWYEQAHADNLEAAYPLLAHHWLHAAEGGDDAPARKARGYLARAGHQALRLCAYPEALSFLQRALALTPASPEHALERAGLLTAAGVAHEKMADYVPATRLLLEALELAHAASDPRAQSRALAELSWVAVRRGEYARAERLGEEALGCARQAGDRPACAKAGSRLGVIAAYQGHYPAAARRFEESLELYRALGEAEGVASCLNSLGLVEVFRGDLEPALHRFEEALAVARGVSNPEIVGKIQANLGLVAEKRGDYAEAARHYGESLAVFREISARHAALINVLNLGDVAAAQGDDARAGGYYREALAEALGLGALPIALGTLRGMAAVWARDGEPLRAAELLGLALSHPASDAEMRQQAEPVLEGLRALLPPEALEAALARGRATTLEEVLRQWGGPAPGEAAPRAPAEG